MTGSLIDFRDGRGGEWPTLEQDGRTVFRWAVWHTAKKIREMLAQSGLTVEDIDVFVPPSANMRIVDELAKQLGLGEDVVIARDIAETGGNTSAASIPLATHRLIEEGAARSGDVLVQFGFGAGLAYAGQVIVLPLRTDHDDGGACSLVTSLGHSGHAPPAAPGGAGSL